ncbi:hypothetical protein BH10BAC4_BH10BAC4_23810 [soil metagenome]
MRLSLAFCLLLASIHVGAQGQKVWSVVIGISDYEFLDDLEYADDDAIAFQKVLVNSLGKNYLEEQTRVLLNKEATSAAIEASMRWLLNNAKEGDRIFLYFSGHGGFEDLTDFKLGYLHAHNAFNETFSNGGNISLEFLQAFLQTLSRRNINTVFIADACHSGKSDGNGNGFMFLNNSLASETQNISKILSAQGNERSYEEVTWGGGHGVFTFYLIRGLMGFADLAPEDGLISMLEIERYLFDKVPGQTHFLQNPKVVSNRKDSYLTKVNPASLEVYKKLYKEGESFNLLDALSKSDESALLNTLTDSAKVIYENFKQSLVKGNLTLPVNENAFSYYQLFKEAYPDDNILELMEEKLYIATMDGAQGYINYLLEVAEDNGQFDHDEKFAILNAAKELMKITDKNDPLFQHVSKMHSLMASEVAHGQFDLDKIKLKKYLDCLPPLLELSKNDSTSAFLSYAIGNIYYHADRFDKALIYASKAVQLAPKWSAPQNQLGNIYRMKKDRVKSFEAYQSSVRLKPKYPVSYRNLGDAYEIKKSNVPAVKISYLDSAIHYYTMAFDRWQSVDTKYVQLIAISFVRRDRFDISKDIEDIRETVRLMQQAFDIKPDDPFYYKQLAQLQTKLNDKAPDSDITMVRYFSLKRNYDSAIASLRKAILKGYKPDKEFEDYPQVKELIKTEVYRNLKKE